MQWPGHWPSWTGTNKVALVVEDAAASTTPKSSPACEQSFEVSSGYSVVTTVVVVVGLVLLARPALSEKNVGRTEGDPLTAQFPT